MRRRTKCYGRQKVSCIKSTLLTPCIPVSMKWGYKGALDNLCIICSAYGISLSTVQVLTECGDGLITTA